ncbi:FG-GAP-like repeat-containing protein [Streptomyces sp. NPDC047829]|uniref:FG-GAP-like repeat-containing protein n=1 Tax=Streptomyces sp. NPDC047829 TaxID=3154609 RepID=UPI0033E399DE
MSRPLSRSLLLAGSIVACSLTGLSAPPAVALNGAETADASLSFVAKINVGDQRACTGTLVDPQWVLTAASCFASDAKPAAGKPAVATTVTVGRTDLTQTGGSVQPALALVPHADRDLVLVRLSKRIADPAITPVPIASAPAASGEELTKAGFGRTRTEWVPNKLHTGTFTVASTTDTAVNLNGSDTATVCQGDAGGPALRSVNGSPQLVSVSSRSWQGGCLGIDPAETRTGAVDTRVDDLAGWVKEVVSREKVTPADIDGDGKDDLVLQRIDGSVVVHRNLGTSFGPGTVMSSGWGRFVTGTDLGRLYFADITGDGKDDMVVHTADGNVAVRKNMGTYFDGGTHWSAGWGRFVTGTDLGRLYFADITGDGKDDMVVHTADGNVAVRRNMGTYFDGGTHWSAGWGRFVTGTDLGRLYFADITGDGKDDMVVHTADGNVAVRKNMGTYFDGGTHWSAGWGRFLTGADLGRLRFGDVTGDGKADLYVHVFRNGEVSVRTNKGTYFDGGTVMATLQ